MLRGGSGTVKVENVEKSIGEIEGFNVCIRYPNGKNVRGDRADFPTYRFQKAAPDKMTVYNWKRSRFRTIYVGFHVDVLDGGGEKVIGNTRLRTVRNSYT